MERLLGDYIYDASLLNASICVEIDMQSGQVYSVFYDTKSDKLRFNQDGATNIYDRSYDHRRNDALSATTLPRTASTLCSWCRRS